MFYLQTIKSGTNVLFSQVDIGDGVLVDERTLSRLRRDAKDSGPRLARGFLKVLFSPEELEGKSLFGKKSNAHKNAAQKEALDFRRVYAILGMCEKVFSICFPCRFFFLYH